MRIRFRSWHDESVRFKEFEWLTLIFNTFSSENYQSFTCHKNDEWAKNINLWPSVQFEDRRGPWHLPIQRSSAVTLIEVQLRNLWRGRFAKVSLIEIHLRNLLGKIPGSNQKIHPAKEMRGFNSNEEEVDLQRGRCLWGKDARLKKIQDQRCSPGCSKQAEQMIAHAWQPFSIFWKCCVLQAGVRFSIQVVNWNCSEWARVQNWAWKTSIFSKRVRMSESDCSQQGSSSPFFVCCVGFSHLCFSFNSSQMDNSPFLAPALKTVFPFPL